MGLPPERGCLEKNESPSGFSRAAIRTIQTVERKSRLPAPAGTATRQFVPAAGAGPRMEA
jgi:hypothetical protein